MAFLKIKAYKKVYIDDDGEKIIMQPVICSNCNYDSAMDEIESHLYCPNCGEKIEGITGKILDDE